MGEAPKQEGMGGGEGIEEMVGGLSGLLVKQTARGCLQECMGCEAKSEFVVSEFDPSMHVGSALTDGAMDKPNIMYALESSSCCCRLCWRDGRPFDMPVSKGGEAGGGPIVNFKKPCGLPLNMAVPVNKDGGTVDVPCCCMLPEIYTVGLGAADEETSRTKYQCDICLNVPKLMYQEKTNGAWEDIYKIRPETCCIGCCIKPRCGGGRMCTIPFYLWDAKNPDQKVLVGGKEESPAMIEKVWAGLAKECCTTADTFAIVFPDDIKPERKMGLLGATFLLDFVVFERQQE